MTGGGCGLILDKKSADPLATGLFWALDGAPCWETGMDNTRDYPGVPDLVLAYNAAVHSDNLRMRADDARAALGPQVGHPVLPFQLSLEPAAANGGLCVGTSGYQWSAYFYNRDAGNNETAISFDNLWLVGSDLPHTGSTDFMFWSLTARAPVLELSTNGIGFLGAAPTTRPPVTGSWSDGSAAKSLLAALVKLGLVEDRSTP